MKGTSFQVSLLLHYIKNNLFTGNSHTSITSQLVIGT